MVEIRMFSCSYVPTPSMFAYCSGFHLSGENDRERIIDIAKKKKLMIFLRRFSPPESMDKPNIPLVIRSLMLTMVVLLSLFGRH